MRWKLPITQYIYQYICRLQKLKSEGTMNITTKETELNKCIQSKPLNPNSVLWLSSTLQMEALNTHLNGPIFTYRSGTCSHSRYWCYYPAFSSVDTNNHNNLGDLNSTWPKACVMTQVSFAVNRSQNRVWNELQQAHFVVITNSIVISI